MTFLKIHNNVTTGPKKTKKLNVVFSRQSRNDLFLDKS